MRLWPGPNAKTDAIWPAAHDLRNDRNLIAHGVWVVDDDARPIVVWHRKFLESEEYITGEYLDYRRFASFQARGQLLPTTSAELKRLLEEALEEEATARGSPA